MEKSADAFRTISEVADDLDLPQHVLRFWETRFPQIRPMKRAGGRRYYRPGDIAVLRNIRQLLYDQGYTIKGVQRLLKERKIRDLGEGLLAVVETVPEPDRSMSADTPSASDDVSANPPHEDIARASSVAGAVVDLETLRDAIAIVEDCERILTSALRSRA